MSEDLTMVQAVAAREALRRQHPGHSYTGDEHVDYVADAKAKDEEEFNEWKAKLAESIDNLVDAAVKDERERVINLIASWEPLITNRAGLCAAVADGVKVNSSMSAPLAQALGARRP